MATSEMLYDSQDGTTHDGSPSRFIKDIAKLCRGPNTCLRAVITYNLTEILSILVDKSTPTRDRAIPLGRPTA